MAIKQANERHKRAKPMTTEESDRFHADAVERFGLEARQAAAVKNGSTLMVQSLVEPGSVTYKVFKEQIAERDAQVLGAQVIHLHPEALGGAESAEQSAVNG